MTWLFIPFLYASLVCGVWCLSGVVCEMAATAGKTFGPSASTEVRLDPAATQDIIELYHTTPSIKMARDAFVSMVFCGAFKVIMKTLPLQNNRELEILIELYWVRWQRDVYDWIKMFGVAVYYFKRVSKSNHFIPIVPPVGSGYITTYMTRDHEQRFKWYWMGEVRVSEDTGVHWVLSDHLPTIHGQYRSPVHTLLPDFRGLRDFRRDARTASFGRANPPFIYEHRPPKGGPHDDNLIMLDAFSDKSAGAVLDMEGNLQKRKARISSQNLFDTISRAHMRNMRASLARTVRRRGPFKASEDVFDKWEDENPGFYTRAVPLAAHHHYVSPAQPGVVVDIEKIALRLDNAAGGIMDYPMNMINPQSGSRSATSNVQSNLRFINEKIKWALAFFSSITKRAFLISYGQVLQRGLNEFVRLRRKNFGPRAMMDLHVELEVEIEMSCTPIISLDDLDWIHNKSLMRKRDIGRHALHNFAIPLKELHVTEWPDMVPRELLIKQPSKQKTQPAATKKRERRKDRAAEPESTATATSKKRNTAAAAPPRKRRKEILKEAT